MKALPNVMLALFLGAAVVGCSREETPEHNRIKVLSSYTEQQFFTQYGNYFAVKFPDLQVEFASSSDVQSGLDIVKQYSQKLETERPDLVLLSTQAYIELARSGLLLDLNPFIRRDRFDIDQLAPVVVDFLSQGEGNKLYGLGTRFNSSVLLYNKDLFTEYSVPEPAGNISWEQLYSYSRHFSITDSRKGVYGYHRPFMLNPFSFVQEIAASNGLSLVNTSLRQVTIDTEGWRKAFQLVIDGIQNGSLGSAYRTVNGKVEQADTRNANLFAQGKAAMTTDNFTTISELIANPPAFQWGIAGAPGVPSAEATSRNLTMSYPIFAIHAKADHAETAWQVMQYLNSDEVARIRSRLKALKAGDLPVRRNYAPNSDSHDIDIFYRVSSFGLDSIMSMAEYNSLPLSFRQVMGSIITDRLDDVLTGESTLDEALKQMQEQEQAALDAAMAAETKS